MAENNQNGITVGGQVYTKEQLATMRPEEKRVLMQKWKNEFEDKKKKILGEPEKIGRTQIVEKNQARYETGNGFGS